MWNSGIRVWGCRAGGRAQAGVPDTLDARRCSGRSFDSGTVQRESEFRPALELLELSSSSSSEQGTSRKRRELDPVHRQARGEAHIVPYGFARSCGPPQVRDRASRNAEQFGDRGMGFLSEPMLSLYSTQ